MDTAALRRLIEDACVDEPPPPRVAPAKDAAPRDRRELTATD
jgi:hypothetical protein